MQSGMGKTHNWVLEYEQLTKRSPEPLMGWSQSDDTLNQVKMNFPSLDAAVAHAEKQGWTYSVSVDKQKKIRPRSYMDNFKYIPVAEEKA